MLPVCLYLAVLACLIGATALVLRAVPALRRAVLAGNEGRNHALDGARGVLALSVMLHHTLTAYWLRGDPQRLPDHPVISQMGSAAVALFFMISAYLFVGRLFRSGGTLDVPRFAVGRVRRIVPLYLVAVGLVALTAFAAQRGALVVPPLTLAKQLVRHLLFDFVPRHEINGFALAPALMGPAWTLRYEWLLYLQVPVLAFLYRRVRHPLAIYLPLLAEGAWYDPLFFLFAAGAAAAQLDAVAWSRRALTAWSIAGSVTLAADVALFPLSDGWRQALLLLPTAVAIVRGHRWFALLGLPPLRVLGEVSFSFYLLQGSLIYLLTRAVPVAWPDLDPIRFVVTDVLLGAGVVAISIATFLLVEKPLMHAAPARPS